MKVIERTIKAGAGPHPEQEQTAQVVVCEKCGGEWFGIFFVHNAQHLICSLCETSYCDGGDCAVKN